MNERQVYHLHLSKQELGVLQTLRDECGIRSINHTLQALLRAIGSNPEELDRVIDRVYKSS